MRNSGLAVNAWVCASSVPSPTKVNTFQEGLEDSLPLKPACTTFQHDFGEHNIDCAGDASNLNTKEIEYVRQAELDATRMHISHRVRFGDRVLVMNNVTKNECQAAEAVAEARKNKNDDINIKRAKEAEERAKRRAKRRGAPHTP